MENPPSLSVPDDSTREPIADLVHAFKRDGKPAELLASAAHQTTAQTQPAALAGDILHGAAAIAEFLFGDRSLRRKVYTLVESGTLPTFRLGSICARKSVLLTWITQQEKGGQV